VAEELTYTAPLVTAQKISTGVRVKTLLLEVEAKHFLLAVRGTQGEVIEADRTGAVAITLMRQLNTNNGQVESLELKALKWLKTQPEGASLQGAITGVPD
jgi:hypothetical protein